MSEPSSPTEPSTLSPSDLASLSVPYTIINSKVYDLTDFLSTHPGGPILRLAIGREATELYQSYHPRSSILHIRRALHRLPILGKIESTPLASSAFFYTLRSRVEDFLNKENLSYHSYQLHTLLEIYFTFLLYIIFSLQVVLLPNWCWTFSILSGLFMARLGFIMHSGNHAAISDFVFLNQLAGKLMNLIGGSTLIWLHEHQIAHHLTPNVIGQDNDCEIGYPYIRLHPSLPWKERHRYQLLTLFLGMSFGLVKWAISDLYHLRDRRVGHVTLYTPTKLEYLELILGKLFWFGIHFLAPCYLLGVPLGLGSFLLRTTVASHYLENIFIVNHIQEPAMKDNAAVNDTDHWAVKQVKGTTNWSSGSTFFNWLSGGLNHQIEHHLFPSMNPYLYPRIASIVKQTCQDFQLPYVEYQSFGSAWMQMSRWIYRLGRPPKEKY